jgi:hypothetical protein
LGECVGYSAGHRHVDQVGLGTVKRQMQEAPVAFCRNKEGGRRQGQSPFFFGIRLSVSSSVQGAPRASA